MLFIYFPTLLQTSDKYLLNGMILIYLQKHISQNTHSTGSLGWLTRWLVRQGEGLYKQVSSYGCKGGVGGRWNLYDPHQSNIWIKGAQLSLSLM